MSQWREKSFSATHLRMALKGLKSAGDFAFSPRPAELILKNKAHSCSRGNSSFHVCTYIITASFCRYVIYISANWCWKFNYLKHKGECNGCSARGDGFRKKQDCKVCGMQPFVVVAVAFYKPVGKTNSPSKEGLCQGFHVCFRNVLMMRCPVFCASLLPADGCSAYCSPDMATPDLHIFSDWGKTSWLRSIKRRSTSWS